MDNAAQIKAIQAILGKGTKNHNGRLHARKTERMTWTIQDEQIALDLYFCNAQDDQIKEVCAKKGIKVNSMKMKLSNISFLDGNGGLENVSDTTRALFAKRK